MTKETMSKILALYDRAQQDTEYLTLHKDYTSAQAVFAAFLCRLSESDRQIVEDYLLTSTALYHRLLDLTFTMQEERTGS